MSSTPRGDDVALSATTTGAVQKVRFYADGTTDC